MDTYVLLIAFFVDHIWGDPLYAWHPVRLMGRLALYIEEPCRGYFKSPEDAGSAAAISVIAISAICALILCQIFFAINHTIGFLVALYFIYTSIACRDMQDHSKSVARALKRGDLEEARVQVGKIVGRDTEKLTETEISRATVESIAENLVDGVTAPIFYAFIGFLFGGILGAAVMAVFYRAVNTLDSTFGYKNEKYLHFGRASAQIDDAFNYIPARITLLAITVGAYFAKLDIGEAYSIGRADGGLHESPNSGISEAAYAGALGVELGGGATYGGVLRESPVINKGARAVEVKDIKRANNLSVKSALFMTAVFTIILWIFCSGGGAGA